MPPQGRVSDLALAPADAHGCPACPHPTVGPAIVGSSDVLTNGLPSLRVGDAGIHAACCGPNKWNAKTGSATVLINGRRAHRLSDMTKHCGGIGQLIVGSPNVIVGDSGAGGGGVGQNTESTTATAASGPAASAPPKATSESPPDPTAESTTPAPPKQVPAKWNLVYADGRPVQGFRSRLARARDNTQDEQELHPDGQGRNELAAMDENEAFAVTPVGIERASGTVKDSEGKPVARAKLTIIRAFGPEVTALTSGGGTFEAKGLLQDEPYEVVVHPPDPDARGRFVDEAGKPVPVRAAAWLDRRRVVELPVGADGTYKLEGRPTGDAYDLLFVSSLIEAKGRFIDERGVPIAGLRLRAHLSSRRCVEAISGNDGSYSLPGVMPDEAYSLEILSPAPRQAGR